MNELERLKALLDSGQVKLGIHIRRMNSPGSPVYQSWENVWPAGLVLFASFAALKWGGWLLEPLGIDQPGTWAGMVVLAIGCWWWIARVMPRIKDGVFDRSAAYALQSPAHFDAMWAKGILSLYAKMPDGTERAATRSDNWRSFVTAIEELLPASG